MWPRGQELREPLLTGRPVCSQLLQLGRQVCDGNRLMHSILRCRCGCLRIACGVHYGVTAAGWLTIDSHGLHPVTCTRNTHKGRSLCVLSTDFQRVQHWKTEAGSHSTMCT